MVVVGSRCGGFDFYAQKHGESFLTWLGPIENSDIDVFYNDVESINIFPFKKDARPIKRFKIPNLWCGIEFPYQMNGSVFIPKDMSYLSAAIQKRLKLSPKDRFMLRGCKFDIFDKDKTLVTTINFKIISPLASVA